MGLDWILNLLSLTLDFLKALPLWLKLIFNYPMTLLDQSIKTGQTLEIKGFAEEPMMREHLHEMGLRAGLRLKFMGRAPFGGPLLLRFNTSFIAVRNEEAQCILVNPL